MAGSIGGLGAVFVALSSILYWFVIKDVLLVACIGRVVQPVSDFPLSCRQIRGPALQACEDMHFDAESRQLYLACSTSETRRSWLPNVGKLDATKLTSNDRVVVVDVDKPTGDTYAHTILRMPNFDQAYHALSVTVVRKPDSAVNQLYLINNRPTLDPTTGTLLDNTKTGHNATVELFEHEVGSDELLHVRTFASSWLATPNNVAVMADGNFFTSNDHGMATYGALNQLSPLIHTGNIVRCNPSRASASDELPCHPVQGQLSFPNGVLIPDSHPNLLFVASAGFSGYISIYTINPHSYTLELLQTVTVDMPTDNLTYDPATRSVLAVGIPKALEFIQSYHNATHDHSTPSKATVWRLTEQKNVLEGTRKWVADKLVEDDGSGAVFPYATTAVGVGGGRVWLSGIASSFVSVCEPRRIASGKAV